MEFFPGLRAMENLHPVFVHAPLTLLPLALVFQALAVWFGSAHHRWRGREEWQKLALWFLCLGAIGALAGAGSGLWAEEEVIVPDAGIETIERHEMLMLITAGLAVALAAGALWLRKRLTRGLQAGLLAGLVVLNGILMVGADLGGRLVYEFGVSVQKEAPGSPPAEGAERE